MANKLPSEEEIRKDLSKKADYDNVQKNIRLKFTIFIFFCILLMAFFTSEFFWSKVNSSGLDEKRSFFIDTCYAHSEISCSSKVYSQTIDIYLNIKGQTLTGVDAKNCNTLDIDNNTATLNCSLSSLYNALDVTVIHRSHSSGLEHRSKIRILKHFEVTTLKRLIFGTTNKITSMVL